MIAKRGDPDRATGRIRHVRKRDSRIVPFDESKIADAIYAAFRSVGEGDQVVAAELASAVTHFLEGRCSPAPATQGRELDPPLLRTGEGEGPGVASPIPGIEEIQDLVETVLIEMGHARAAKAYILYRQKRAMLRETVQVRRVPWDGGEDLSYGEGAEASGAAAAPQQPLPQVDRGIDGFSCWQKSRIAAALIREADLDPSIAAEIASNVERKVLASGSKRISTSLVRELVDNELFERGFSAKLQKQAAVGFPKYNLEQLIFGTDSKEGYTFPKTPPEIRNTIADHILHQYSLMEVFTPQVADAYRDSRIFIHRLSDPIRLSRLRWGLPAPGAARGLGEASGAEIARAGCEPAAYLDLSDFFRRLWHLSHFFSEELRLTNLSRLLLDPAWRALSTPERVQSVLERLSQMEARPDIALEFDLAGESLPWLRGLRELSRSRPGRFLLALRVPPELFSDPAAPALLETIADLYAGHERLEFLPARREGEGAGARGPEAGERGDRRLRANLAKITINLPRAAFRSAIDNRRSIETEVDEVLDIAVKGHLERRRFVERLGSNRENPLWDLLGKAGGAPSLGLDDLEFSVGILGLNECVKFLTGNEIHQDAAAARLGQELMRAIHRRLQREERSLGLRLVLEETANVGPLRRLEGADRRKYPQMAEVERGRQPQWGASYTHGVRLHRMAPVDPLRRVEDLAGYLPWIRPAGGFLEESPELRRSAGELLSSLLEECVQVVVPAGR